MTAYSNRLLSLKELSTENSIRYQRVLAWSELPDFPSIQYGTQKKVWRSDFYDWTHKHFGLDGDMRGQEDTEISTTK